jgi:hypothetical protein
MAKTRLLKADRDAIRVALLEHKFAPRVAALKRAREAAALALYDRLHAPHLKAMAALPEWAFGRRNNLLVKTYGRLYTLEFADAEDRPVLHKYLGHIELGTTTQADDIEALTREDKTIVDERLEMAHKVTAALEKFSSFEDAIKAWPEAASFFNARMKERGLVVNLPAVMLMDLTKQLDLPPDDA